jgi:hypothetical protein
MKRNGKIAPSRGQMTNSQIFRISGLGLLIGALVFILHVALRSVITAGVDPATFPKDSLWVPVNLLGVVGAILVLLGLPAMYAWMAALFGLSGLIGVVLFAIAWMFVGLFLSLYSVLILPWLAERAPSLIAASAPLPVAFVIAFLIGLVAWLAGSVLLAIPFIRKRAQPTWVGYALVASGVWIVIGNLIIAPSGPASNLAVNLLSNLGPVLLLIGVAHLGYRMSSEKVPTVVKDSRLTSQ